MSADRAERLALMRAYAGRRPLPPIDGGVAVSSRRHNLILLTVGGSTVAIGCEFVPAPDHDLDLYLNSATTWSSGPAEGQDVDDEERPAIRAAVTRWCDDEKIRPDWKD